ncbi:MAG: maleylpyruvate isomerase family mycothiol-dependent enzyme [Microthrixaceae bacterium]
MDMWGAIAEERTSILDTFENLTGAQWATQSLCGEWTVRQVLGHLVVAADPPIWGLVGAFAKARGNFDRANDMLARAEAKREPEELITRYRVRLGARSTPPGFGPEAPLTDVLLHSLDVRIPLGLPTERPSAVYAKAMELLLSPRGTRVFAPKGRPEVRWSATDLPWSVGSGDEVHGTMADLALAASGRSARLGSLSGPGTGALATWLKR